MVTRTLRTLTSILLFSIAITAGQVWSQTVEMAGLRPELVWQRISPTAQSPEGPVLYQIQLTLGTPGSVPKYDTSGRHFTGSLITDDGAKVAIGSMHVASNGIITFAGGQTFPGGTGVTSVGLSAPASDFTVTGSPVTTSGTLALAWKVAPTSGNTANAIVKRDATGSFIAQNELLQGNLTLLQTNGAGTAGIVTVSGTRFISDFGSNNTFVGASSGNTAVTASGNSGFGTFALESLTSGGNNAAFGLQAMFSDKNGSFNSAFGVSALQNNTSGTSNSAFGSSAMAQNTTGNGNVAVGDSALGSNTTALSDTAVGFQALLHNTTAANNTGLGAGVLSSNTTGTDNTALGADALLGLNGGSDNVAIGSGAGLSLTGTETADILISSNGVAGESGVIRIGSAQSKAFIAGIDGSSVDSGTGTAVFVDSNGQLGTVKSSLRYKQEIVDLGEESDVLMKLRPVAFYYRPQYDASHTRQYGLVAEEVAKVAPGLVIFDRTGRPESVHYELVNAMLLNEVQKQQKRIADLEAESTNKDQKIATLESEMRAILERVQALERSATTTQVASAR